VKKVFNTMAFPMSCVIPSMGQGPSDVKRVLYGSGLHTAPDHHQDISEGTFEDGQQGRIYLKGTQSVL